MPKQSLNKRFFVALLFMAFIVLCGGLLVYIILRLSGQGPLSSSHQIWVFAVYIVLGIVSGILYRSEKTTIGRALVGLIIAAIFIIVLQLKILPTKISDIKSEMAVIKALSFLFPGLIILLVKPERISVAEEVQQEFSLHPHAKEYVDEDWNQACTLCMLVENTTISEEGNLFIRCPTCGFRYHAYHFWERNWRCPSEGCDFRIPMEKNRKE